MTCARSPPPPPQPWPPPADGSYINGGAGPAAGSLATRPSQPSLVVGPSRARPEVGPAVSQNSPRTRRTNPPPAAHHLLLPYHASRRSSNRIRARRLRGRAPFDGGRPAAIGGDAPTSVRRRRPGLVVTRVRVPERAGRGRPRGVRPGRGAPDARASRVPRDGPPATRAQLEGPRGVAGRVRLPAGPVGLHARPPVAPHRGHRRAQRQDRPSVLRQSAVLQASRAKRRFSISSAGDRLPRTNRFGVSVYIFIRNPRSIAPRARKTGGERVASVNLRLAHVPFLCESKSFAVKFRFLGIFYIKCKYFQTLQLPR